MQIIIPLEPGCIYHIYNRGINGENLFVEERNYSYFLSLYAKYIPDVADTFAYCLLKNHFHLLVRIKETVSDDALVVASDGKAVSASRKFSHLFNSYAQSINAAYNRTGGLFETPFRRKKVDCESYFSEMVRYIHHNPVKHGFAKDLKAYPWSSYHALTSPKHTRLYRDEVLAWFGGSQKLEEFHLQEMSEVNIAKYAIELD